MQQSNESPQEFAEQVVREGHLYNGFNLVVADICTSTMVYVFNRPDRDNPSYALVTPGIHVLANASLDAPWAKVTKQSCCYFQILFSLYLGWFICYVFRNYTWFFIALVTIAIYDLFHIQNDIMMIIYVANCSNQF